MLKKKPQSNEEDVAKYAKKIRRSTRYSKQRRVQAEKMFHKVLSLGVHSPSEAYDIAFMTTKHGIQTFKKNRTIRTLKAKQNDSK